MILIQHLGGIVLKNVTLFKYQQTGVDWLSELASSNMNGILADEMGLGKTLQVLGYLENRRTKVSKFKVLIAAPAALVLNWQSEIEKYTNFTTDLLLWGGRKETLKTSDADILLTSYGTLTRDKDMYSAGNPFTDIILDEAQNYKNDWTKLYKMVSLVTKDTQSFALTGTPIENSPENLYNIMKATHILGVQSKVVLRRTKEMVKDELNIPSMKFSLVPVDLHSSSEKLYNSMIGEYWKLYFTHDGMEAKINSARMNHQPLPEGYIESSNRLGIRLHGMRMQLVELLDEPALLQRHLKLEKIPSSSKTEALNAMIKIKHSQGGKVIIFSQFVRMIELLQKQLPEKGIKCLSITGHQNAYDRVKIANQFNDESDDTQVLLVSMKAGGTGLNITGASTIIFYDSWWNPAVEEQAIGRSYRIGQKRHINVYKLYTRDTIEESILKSQKRKEKYYTELNK